MHSAKVLSGVPKCKKAVRVCVLGKFHLDMIYSAVGNQLNINESTIYI